MPRLWLFIAFILSVHTLPVFAQEPAGILQNHRAEAVFPLALRFSVDVLVRQESLQSGKLELFQSGGFTANYPLDFNTDLAESRLDSLVILKTISFDLQNAPVPFVPINYRWQFTTHNGETAEAAGEVLFVPSGESWQQVGDETLILYWNTTRSGYDLLRNTLLGVHALLREHTQTNPTLRYAIYEADYAFCSDDPACSLETIRAYYARHGILLVQRHNTDFIDLENQLVAALVGAFYAPHWAAAPPPPWFQSGLASLYQKQGDYRAVVTVRGAADREQLLSLRQLGQAPPENAQELWQAQSYLLVLYLADTYGANIPFALANAADFDTTLKGLVGESDAGFFRAWRSWIDLRGAEVAVLWNPYLLTTPTPTPTRTNTPIPPTRTATRTPTITPSPTSTSLIGRVPTQQAIQATLPPSPTLIPTLTNTPLPAGSLARPTPQPTTEAQSGGLPCGASALILPVVGLALLKRRKRQA